MVNIFETRELTLGDIHKNDQTPSWKVNLQRVSDWRKGIAVARYYKQSIKPSWHYFLIDDDYNYFYEKSSWNEDEIEGEQIERVFGGYYIVRDVKLDGCRTFPGQDRDTEYYYSTCIKEVIDENGTILTKDERIAYLESNPINQTTEYGDGIIQCGLSFYRLDNYQHVFDLQKEVAPLGIFREGKCKVKVITDYRDFVVLVKDKRITHVFNAEDFIFISKLLGIDLETWGKESLQSSRKPYYKSVRKPNDITSFKEIKPEIEIYIHNYEIGVSSYSIDCGGELYYDDNYGFYRTQLIPGTSYYYVEDEWRKISEADSKPIFDKIFKKDCNRPNFIKDIKIIARDILLDEEEYSLYKFECRPYGYLTKDGKFEYDFDVNNIKW